MKKLLILLTALVFTASLTAQKKADWSKTFPTNINWYMITDAGTNLVATKDALYGMAPDGKELWKLDGIENIKSSNVEAIEGTPYVVLTKQKLVKTFIDVVDVITGKVVVNSEDLGFYTLAKRSYMPRSNRMMLYGSGKTGSYLAMVVDLANGAKVWEQKSLFEKNSEQLVSDAKEIGDAIFLATNKNIYKLNKQTGDILFSMDMKSDLPVAKAEEPKTGGGVMGALGKGGGLLGGGLGGLMKGAGNASNNASAFGGGAQARTTAIAADFFESPYNKGNVYFWNQDYITAIDNASGKESWTRVKLPSPVGYILHDEKGMIVTTKEKREEDLAKSGKGLAGKIAAKKDRSAVLLLDAATGKEKWNSDVDLKGDILAYRKSGNKLILGTQQDDGDNYISIVDLDAGKSISKKPLRIKGTISDLQIFPQGLYYRTTDQINILDLESGEKTWKKGFNVENCIGYNKDSKTGYVGANGKIYKVDFVQGDINVWKDDLKFDRNETPNRIAFMGDKIFVSSDQNAALYNEDGSVVYHTYVPAPGRTMGGKILSGLGGAAALAMGAAATAHSAQLSYAKGYYGISDPQLDSEIKNSSALGSSMLGASVSSFQSISKRFSATQQANNSLALLTSFGSNQGKDAGITIVDKSNGKRIADFLLGDKKDPDYRIDELGRVIYYRTDGNTLEGFLF